MPHSLVFCQEGPHELGRKTPTKDIVEHLAGKCIELVEKVNAHMKPGLRSRHAKATVAVSAVKANGQITYEHLLADKTMADELGGTESLRRTLELLEKLR